LAPRIFFDDLRKLQGKQPFFEIGKPEPTAEFVMRLMPVFDHSKNIASVTCELGCD
jgi:hypothetical protein